MGDKFQRRSKSKLKRNIEGDFGSRRQKSKKEEQEFGKGKRDIIICSDCKAVYSNKRWKHDPLLFELDNPEIKLIFKLCPACQMMKNKTYEGIVVLKGISSAKKKEEILRLVKNIGQRAYQRDPLDRIIKIKDKKKEVEILTTENQLAVSIGKQIKKAFKGNLEINFSHREDIARVTWRP